MWRFIDLENGGKCDLHLEQMEVFHLAQMEIFHLEQMEVSKMAAIRNELRDTVK